MSGLLKLSIHDNGDGTGELFAVIETHGFSGRGQASFELQDLLEKVEEFAQYPLPSKEPVCIRGGYWTDDAKQIREEHLSISAYPTNSLGEIGLLVKLAEPHDDYSLGTLYSLSAELKINYEQIAQLSKDLSSLVRGNLTEIIVLDERP